jgi:lysophospholipase L1-like esterase
MTVQAWRYRSNAQRKDAAITEMSIRSLVSDLDARNRELAAAAVGPIVAFVGDSNVLRWHPEKRFTKFASLNRGIGGFTSAQIRGRIGKDVISVHAEAVVILGGTNDFLRSPECVTAAHAAFDNLTNAARTALLSGASVYLASVLPISPGSSSCQRGIKELNEHLLQQAGVDGYTFVDFHSQLADTAGGFRPDLSDDGIHANERGFTLMSTRLMEIVDKVPWINRH